MYSILEQFISILKICLADKYNSEIEQEHLFFNPNTRLTPHILFNTLDISEFYKRQKLKQLKTIYKKEFNSNSKSKSKSNSQNIETINTKYLDIVKDIMPYIEIKEDIRDLEQLWVESEKKKIISAKQLH